MTSRTGLPGLSRRSVLAAGMAAGTGAVALPAMLGFCTSARAEEPTFGTTISAIEARLGGRLGVMAYEPKSVRLLVHNANDRFAMASTFKWVLAALILSDVDTGRYRLSDRIAFGQADIVAYSPVTEPLVEGGGTDLETLCRAAVSLSDNTAANLLLARLGGPQGFTARLRRWDDDVTRLDRWEPALNENAAGDERDTTSPAAMVALMRTILFGDILMPSSSERLREWMIASPTGMNRLRARFPANWIVGDKTGTGMNGAVNDVAFAMSAPDGAPIFLACYMDAITATREEAEIAHQEIAQLVMANMLDLPAPAQEPQEVQEAVPAPAPDVGDSPT